MDGSIVDILDPEFAQAEYDCENEAVDDPSNLQSEYLSTTSESKISFNKPIELVNINDLRDMYLKCDKEQTLVIDIAVNYAKTIKKCSQTLEPPPLIVVQGGAGSGKSRVINLITQCVERILRKGGDEFSYPYVIKAAPTGTAASNIQGNTLHSLFNFSFGNEFESLSDKKRDIKRQEFKNVSFLIIDEISMMNPDLLYKIDQRMKEIKMVFNKPFGGVSVYLFGDLMQLKPVKANYIFQCPRNEKFSLVYNINSYWKMFKPITLCTNHRQGADKNYGDILNNIRIGKLCENDIKTLETRVIEKDFDRIPKDALFITATNKVVNEYNNYRLNQLPGEEIVIKAKVEKNGQILTKVMIESSTNNVVSTPLQETLHLKEGAECMLTFNIDVMDSLTNGVCGKIFGFIKSENIVTTILVEFSNIETGKKLREKLGYASKYPNKSITPINMIEFQYRGKGKVASGVVRQFPLRLAFGATAHKCQGITVLEPKKLVVDLSSVKEKAQVCFYLSKGAHLLYN